jgi:hypothetical protein
VIGIALAAASGLLLLGSVASAAPAPIVMDGVFHDWLGIDPAYSDAVGDGGSSGIDFGDLWIADDPRFLFIRFELGTEVRLNESNSLTIYLDTDNNSSTGLAVNGIGAELKWEFADGSGTYYRSSIEWTVYSDDLRFRSFPTVSSTAFEIAFGRDTFPNGSQPLFFGTQVKIFLRDNQSGGDGLPAIGETLSYTMDEGTLPPDVPIPLGKFEPSDLRIVTMNVKQDTPWEPGEGEKYERQIAAIQPEILNFQEVFAHTHIETRQLVEQWLPGGDWYSFGNADCHTVSRYPLAGVWFLDENLAILLDTSPALDDSLLIINCHLPCCNNDAGRQAEVDRILEFIRDAKTPGGTVTLEAGTPILITGDMNFVGYAQQLNSFLLGDIVDEATYGEDFLPDWDETTNTNLISLQTEKRMAYTWRKEFGTNWPGHLDFMIYTDSAMQAANHYVMFTPEMSADTLAYYGIQGGDSYVADHLIVCADFRPPPASGIESAELFDPRDRRTLRLSIDPNPVLRNTRLRFQLARDARVRISVYDHQGRLVASPLGPGWAELSAGTISQPWDGRDRSGRLLAPGVYFIRLRGQDAIGEFDGAAKWTILR